jgi:MFS family permease
VSRRLPTTFWVLWTGYLANRLGLLSPGFLALYLAGEQVATGAQIGVAIGAYGAGLVGGGLIGGLVADRVGPRRTLWTSQALASATSLALMVTRDPPLVVVLALASGALTGFPRSAVFGLAAHLTEPSQRVSAYGQLYWATSLGSSVSALIAGLLLNLWPPSVFLPPAVSAAAYAAIALALPEVPPNGPPSKGLLAAAWEPFTARCVGPFLVLTLAISGVYMQRQSALPLDMHSNGLSYAELGMVLSLSAILVVVVQPFAGHVTARLRPGRAFAAASALIGVGFGLNLVASTVPGYALAVLTWTCGEILMVPLAAAFMADHAPPGRASTFQGAYAFVWTLGLAVGAPAGQLLLIDSGATALWSGTLALGLCVAVAHLVLAGRCRWLASRAQRPARPGVAGARPGVGAVTPGSGGDRREG